jgi:H+-transporting ATPase
MAIGALALSKMKAIVTRLESIEEMAGIDILCSDKTGTLTQNRLTLGEPVTFGQSDPQDLILAACLASREENRDAIDQAVLGGLENKAHLKACSLLKFIPFDPVHKRTEATVKDNGKIFKVTKGAPQVILEFCHLDGDIMARAQEAVDALAAKGYRTLGVARAPEEGPWQFLGLLPLFDPPREDSAATIAEAKSHGIEVKMITGDNQAIGKEIAKQLGLGDDIQPATNLFPAEEGSACNLTAEAIADIEKADGYAQVFPEHKYCIVTALQQRNHLVGMTGDGVNDAPALKQADVGIAVSGATDAARAAADLVLTEPGLSVIVRAVEEARKIFERMNSYAIYRIVETIRIMFFVVLAMVFYHFYPITAIMIILLAFFNDVPIMAISVDNTVVDPNPVRWNMRRVLTVATVLGLTGVMGSFLMLIVAKNVLKLNIGEIQTFIFLKMAVAGHLTLFVTRTPRMFLRKPHPAPLLLWSAVVTKALATLFVVYPFGLITPISWEHVGIIWAYCLVWLFMGDLAKLVVYRQMEMASPRHRKFLQFVKHRINPYT